MTFRKPDPRGHKSPLVEAVTKHKGDWEVQEAIGIGKTDNVLHRMWVPIDDEPCLSCGYTHNDMTRAHELLHSKISPESPERVTVRAGKETIEVSAKNIEIAEEHRVNFSLAFIEGQEVLTAGFCQDLTNKGVAMMMDSGKYEEIIRVMLTGGPDFDDMIWEALNEYLRRLKDTTGGTRREVRKLIKRRKKVTKALMEAVWEYSATAKTIMEAHWEPNKLPAWSQVEELAAFLEVNFRNFGDQLNNLLGEGKGDLEILLGEPGLEPQAVVTGDGGDFAIGGEGDSGPIRWGQPDKITTARLSQSIPAWKLQKHNRAVEEGTIPRYMHRWPTDQRVFHRTKRVSGGTILIDDSGSMALSSEQLDEMIEAAPAATIALYAGNDGHDGGEIRVVAQNGKRARTDDLSIREFEGNGIDGPALDWLGDQSYPRIWITDGYVTANSGHSNEQLATEAASKCRRYKVSVTETADEAAVMLKTGKLAR